MFWAVRGADRGLDKGSRKLVGRIGPGRRDSGGGRWR